MKVAGLLTVALLSQSALGWTNEDHEIFDIVESLQIAEGKDTTFYTFMNVTQAATSGEISKAYRKRSLELHPDKNPDNQVVADRFARLGTIVGILRDAEKRERYDHFHDNGVPKWRGSGYYYARFRPGFISVLISLTFFSAFVHWILLKGVEMQEKRNLTNFREKAIEFAWGGKAALAGEKKFQITLGPGPGLACLGCDPSFSAKGGDKLDVVCVKDDAFVILDGKRVLVTPALAYKPKLMDTWIPKLIKTTYQRSKGTLPPPMTKAQLVKQAATRATGSASESDEKVEKKVGKVVEIQARKVKGLAKGVQGDAMVAGRRRAGAVRPAKVE